VTDIVAAGFRKPYVTIWPGRDPFGPYAGDAPKAAGTKRW
jgi:hypothetical protein